MSEQAPEAPGRGRPPQAGGGNFLTRKIGGIPAWGWIAAVAGVVGLYFYLQSRKSSASSAQAQSSPASATCYDAQGNPVDCASPQAVGDNSTDQFEALYTQGTGISNELQTLTPQITETGTDVDQIQAQIANSQGPPSTGGGGAGGGGGGKPGPVTDLTVDVISPTLARISWRPPQFASHAPTSTTYTIQVQGKDAAPHNIGSRTSYNVGGLHPGGHYTAVVAATGGPSTSRAFTTPRSKPVTVPPRKKAA